MLKSLLTVLWASRAAGQREWGAEGGDVLSEAVVRFDVAASSRAVLNRELRCGRLGVSRGAVKDRVGPAVSEASRGNRGHDLPTKDLTVSSQSLLKGQRFPRSPFLVPDPRGNRLATSH